MATAGLAFLAGAETNAGFCVAEKGRDCKAEDQVEFDPERFYEITSSSDSEGEAIKDCVRLTGEQQHSRVILVLDAKGNFVGSNVEEIPRSNCSPEQGAADLGRLVDRKGLLQIKVK